MCTSKFNQLAAAALLLTVCALAASAQVITASGKVTLKQPDGTSVPVQGATVKFYRTDIKQELTAKTNKSGEYVNAGIPLVGTFTIAVSAPGARPTYITNVKISQRPQNDFALEPGDGSTLTLEQIRQAAAAGPAAEGAPASSEEAKKRAAEIAAERARVEAANAKATELNAKLPEILKAANQALQAKNYDEAITQYDQGIQLAPDEQVFYRNKLVALRSRGVDRYNAAVKAKDVAGKEAARNDFKAAAETAEKAVSALRARAGSGGGANAGGAAAPGQQQPQDQELDYLEQRSETYRIALITSTQVDTDAAVKAIQEYFNKETDPAKKMKAQASLGDALFAGGKIDESIAAYKQILAQNPNNLDALYGLGIALAADPTGAKTAEGRDMLEQFAKKAPETDPRKQMATEAVAGLNEALKPKPADRTNTNATRRRKG